MKRNRRNDYHGSRSYGPDDPGIGQFSLTTAWFANIVRSRVRSVREFFARSSSSTVLLADGERHFSLLGTSGRKRPDDCPFPTKSSRDHDPRDWRVYP